MTTISLLCYLTRVSRIERNKQYRDKLFFTFHLLGSNRSPRLTMTTSSLLLQTITDDVPDFCDENRQTQSPKQWTILSLRLVNKEIGTFYDANVTMKTARRIMGPSARITRKWAFLLRFCGWRDLKKCRENFKMFGMQNFMEVVNKNWVSFPTCNFIRTCVNSKNDQNLALITNLNRDKYLAAPNKIRKKF